VKKNSGGISPNIKKDANSPKKKGNFRVGFIQANEFLKQNNIYS